MFLLKKLAKKKEKSIELEENKETSQDLSTENKKANKQVLFPIKKTLFSSIYPQQRNKDQENYNEGMVVLRQLQEQVQFYNSTYYSHEKIRRMWKEVDNQVQKLVGSQLSNQILLQFYQWIEKGLQQDGSTYVFILQEMKEYDESRYYFIQFLAEWQTHLSFDYIKECAISLDRALLFLQSHLQSIRTSSEIACFLNTYHLDILKPFRFKQNSNNKMITDNNIQEMACLNILKMILFTFNYKMYIPLHSVEKQLPFILQKETQTALRGQQTSSDSDRSREDNKNKNGLISQNIQMMSEKQQYLQSYISSALQSNTPDSIDKYNYNYNTQTNHTLETILPSYQNLELANQPVDTLYPVSYTLWQEQEMIKSFTNYLTVARYFTKLLVDYYSNQTINTQTPSGQTEEQDIQHYKILKITLLIKSYFYFLDENQRLEILQISLQLLNNCNLDLSNNKQDIRDNKLKQLVQMLMYLLTCDEVDASHKEIVLSNQKVNALIKHFQTSANEEKRVYFHNTQNNMNISSQLHQRLLEVQQLYYPLLDIQQLDIRNTKCSQINIKPRSKCVIYADVLESLSIIDICIGVICKDIKLQIKYQGPFKSDNTSQNNNTKYPIQLFTTHKIDINSSPYRLNFLAQEQGIYTIEFINSYSWFSAKQLEFRINILSPFQMDSKKLNQKINQLFPVSSKPFKQQEMEMFQRKIEAFNQTSDQALLIINNDTLRILYKAKSDKKQNFVEIYKSEDQVDIFSTLEPQIIDSLNKNIQTRYNQESKKHFHINSVNKLAILVVVDNESQKDYFKSDSLFQASISHSFPSSMIFIE